MNLQMHLDTHPKDQVIQALVNMAFTQQQSNETDAGGGVHQMQCTQYAPLQDETMMMGGEKKETEVGHVAAAGPSASMEVVTLEACGETMASSSNSSDAMFHAISSILPKETYQKQQQHHQQQQHRHQHQQQQQHQSHQSHQQQHQSPSSNQPSAMAPLHTNAPTTTTAICSDQSTSSGSPAKSSFARLAPPPSYGEFVRLQRSSSVNTADSAIVTSSPVLVPIEGLVPQSYIFWLKR